MDALVDELAGVLAGVLADVLLGVLEFECHGVVQVRTEYIPTMLYLQECTGHAVHYKPSWQCTKVK